MDTCNYSSSKCYIPLSTHGPRGDCLAQKKYKYDLIKLLLEIYDDPEKMSSAIASRKKGGFDGVAQGVKPNVYDAITMCVDCWNTTSETSVQKCWNKAKCMPVVLDVVVDAAVLNIAVPHDGLDIVSVLSQLQLLARSITDPMVQNDFEGTILMNNNDNTNNDSIRVAVEAWDDLDAD